MKEKKNKNKKALKNPSTLKKSIGELMKDEDGFVSKENILKVGLSTVAALGVVGALTENSSAQIVHTNSVVVGSDASGSCAYHSDHSNYSSY